MPLAASNCCHINNVGWTILADEPTPSMKTPQLEQPEMPHSDPANCTPPCHTRIPPTEKSASKVTDATPSGASTTVGLPRHTGRGPLSWQRRPNPKDEEPTAELFVTSKNRTCDPRSMNPAVQMSAKPSAARPATLVTVLPFASQT